MSDDDDKCASRPLGERFLDFLFSLEIPEPRFDPLPILWGKYLAIFTYAV